MSEMKLIMESWRDYSVQQEAEKLVEEIWRGTATSKTLILENDIKLLEEGRIADFFRDAHASVKSKIDSFKNFTQEKLMSFIKAGLVKISSFFSFMKVLAKKTKNPILLKLFPKYGTRAIQNVLKVLMMPKYLKIGASIIATLLAKAAEYGIQALIDTVSAGGGTAAKTIDFVKDNFEKVKAFGEALIAAIDPNGIMDLIQKFNMIKGTAEEVNNLVDQFKVDLQRQSSVALRA